MSTDLDHLNKRRNPVSVEISLHRDQKGKTWFHSAVLRLQKGRMRITASKDTPALDVFDEKTCITLNLLCDKINSDNQVISLLDDDVDFAKAAGRGMSILSHGFGPGIRQIMIKIKNFFGDPWSLFQPDFLAVSGCFQPIAEPIAQALEKLQRPIFKLQSELNLLSSDQMNTEQRSKIAQIAALVEMQSKMVETIIDDIIGDDGGPALAPIPIARD